MAANNTRKPGEQKAPDPDLNQLDPVEATADVNEKRQDPRTGDAANKIGKQSSAQKADSSRHNFGPIPATGQKAGAFGKESKEE